MWQVISELERRVAARGAAWPLVRDDAGDHPVGELLERARATATLIAELCGARPTVAVEAPNESRPVTAALAVALLDGTVALLSPKASAEEAAMAIEDVAPNAVLASAEAARAWGLRELASAPIDGWVIASPGAREAPEGDARERWGEGVVIGLTSGSTGRPKAIVQSESGMRYATDHAAAAAGLEPGEGVGTVSLLASCPTFAFGPYLCMRYGSPTTIWRSWDPEAALRRLAETDVRWLMCVPTHVLQLAEAARGTGVRLDRIRAIACGGGPMDERLMVGAEEALGVTVLRMFGMSECLGHTTVALTDRPEIRLSTEGYPFAGTEQRIVDGAGRPVRNGAVGEIQVRGPSLLLGYARAGRLQRPPLERDGYFATGDLAARRPDGRLKITGRKKDVIMRGGKGIDPVEVELALTRHPAVDQVCVVGVPDPVMGERVAAAFVGAGGATVEPDDLRAYLEREGIARHKHPEHLLPIEELPRTGTGKVARAEVKELVEGLVAGGRSASPVASSNG